MDALGIDPPHPRWRKSGKLPHTVLQGLPGLGRDEDGNEGPDPFILVKHTGRSTRQLQTQRLKLPEPLNQIIQRELGVGGTGIGHNKHQ